MAQPHTFERAVTALKAGRAIVFPTDTVYGIGVSVEAATTPREVYGVKLRDAEKAVPWLVENREALDVFGADVPAWAHELARRFWPGPMTLIVRANDCVPIAFAGPNRTIALRMPDDETALRLIAEAECPIATSSANVQGHRPPQCFDDVDDVVLAQVAAAIGDDVPRSGLSSTIVDCTGEAPEVLRVGSVLPEQVLAVYEQVQAS